MNSLPPTRNNDVAFSHTTSDVTPKVLDAVEKLVKITLAVPLNGSSGISRHSSAATSLDYVDTIPYSTTGNFGNKPQPRPSPLSRFRGVGTTVHPRILRQDSSGASNFEGLNESTVIVEKKGEAPTPTESLEQWNHLLIQSALRWQNQRARMFGLQLGIGRDGPRRFNWDNQTLEISTKDGGDIVCPATVIGTHYIKSKLFVCGWMDRRLPLSARQSSSSLLAKVQAQDIELFDSMSKERDEIEVWGLAAVAARVSGFDMVCRGRVEQTWMYLGIVLPYKKTQTNS